MNHGIAVPFYMMLCIGFVVLHVLRPDAMIRVLETERGVWLGGVNVGVILGLGLILGAILLAVLNLQRRP